MKPSRRTVLQASLFGCIAAAAETLPAADNAKVEPFNLDEITIGELQERMKSSKLTARAITERYLARIEAVDKKGPAINSVIEVNPDALAIADALDKERKDKGVRGPLHGIPVLIKDNIDTADKMATTAGSLALIGAKPLKDSFVAKRLREAGAILLGKTNLSEWANIRSSSSTSGWSGRGGQTRNPYVLDRNPSGSSSGSAVAVAANLCAVAIGTETNGSIVSPATRNGIVGLKPTVGLVSRSGIIPISHTQDTAGPMGRTVRDVAILLGALTGIDKEDAVTTDSAKKVVDDYTKCLDANGLKGARIGIVRDLFGTNAAVNALMNDAIRTMKDKGATLIDPVRIKTLGRFAGSLVLLYELKADLNAYFAKLGPDAPVHTLKEIIEFNEKNKDKEMPYFGQETFLQAEAKGPLTTKEYVDTLERNRKLSREEGIDAVMDEHKLDALLGPTGGPAAVTDLLYGDRGTGTGGSSTPAAVAGYPHITVPAGFIHGLPVGISLFGRAWSEETLLKLAYAFEQATKVRRPPQFLPTLNPRG
jgi:amidase